MVEIGVLIAILLVASCIIFLFFGKLRSSNTSNTNNIRSNSTNKNEQPILSEQSILVQNLYGLHGKKNVTISASKTRISKNNLQQSDISFLQSLCDVANVFITVNVDNDEEEKIYLTLLSDQIIQKGCNIPVHRILFHESDIGKIAIVRQIRPNLHIDEDLAFCEKMKIYVKNVVCIGDTAKTSTKDIKILSSYASLIPSY